MEETYGPMGMFKARVYDLDIAKVVAGYGEVYTGSESWICADFDHAEETYGPMGMFKARVYDNDIAILIKYYGESTVLDDCQTCDPNMNL